MTRSAKFLAPLLAAALLVSVPSAQAQGQVDCALRFSMAGWSVFYKTASGEGPCPATTASAWRCGSAPRAAA